MQGAWNEVAWRPDVLARYASAGAAIHASAQTGAPIYPIVNKTGCVLLTRTGGGREPDRVPLDCSGMRSTGIASSGGKVRITTPTGTATAAPAPDPACNWDSRGHDAHPQVIDPSGLPPVA